MLVYLLKKKEEKERQFRQPCGIFELHQSADKLTKPSEISTTHQRLNPQCMTFAKLQGGCGHVQWVQRLCTDMTWTFPPCTACRASFCDWHGQERILQMGSCIVSAPFIFYFCLVWKQGSAKTVCWKQQLVLCHHFFCPCFQLMLVVKGSL